MKLTWPDYAKAKDFTCLGTWWLLSGPEQRLKREALARMREEAAGSPGAGSQPARAEGGPFTWEVVDGAAVSARDLLNRAQTGALFGGARVLVVQEAERIPSDEQEKLAKAVGPLPAEVSVILVTAESGERGRRRALRAALQRAIEQQGMVIEFTGMRAAEAAEWAIAQARARGKRLEPAAARKLADQKVGTGLAELESEVEKLSLFVGEIPVITSADVDAVSPRLLEEDVFRLVAAVGERRPGRAVAILRGLLGERREDPQRLLGMLAQSIRLIWQTKLLLERGWRPGQDPDEETAALLPQDRRKNALAQFGSRSWMIQRSMRQANAFSWEQLIRGMRALLSCDLALKGIEGKVSDPALALELMIVQLCTDW
jgi:DNA polymerase-3 subunit delta